ncbi:MAG: ABC transporter ATP-binding protein [Lachnospiraceae bacterium]|nr:ABC transporter ATP-binding protein [Lachnospiraceae bacterium]
MLEIQNLNKSFGPFKALNNLSLSVNDGELFGFVGANGAGKTTTMKICVGLEKADNGSIMIDGIQALDSKGRSSLRGKVGYVPDFFGVYADLTASEYLHFFAGSYNIWGKEADTLTDNLLELVNLSDKANEQVDSLSRGMKQKLCVARALVQNPKILFLDEPASGLDPKARHELKEILRNLSSMGKTIIISSHILPELIEMCSSIGIINHGEMKFNGSIEDALALSTGGEFIEITFSGDPGRALSLIRECPFVTCADLTSKGIRLTASGSDAEYTALLKKLITNDIPVATFSKNHENVEDIFLNIMEGGNANAENNA